MKDILIFMLNIAVGLIRWLCSPIGPILKSKSHFEASPHTEKVHRDFISAFRHNHLTISIHTSGLHISNNHLLQTKQIIIKYFPSISSI